ncbi:MAG TPA: hypothetical protein VGM06_10985, partial [Polyangiaceae bacterium]
CEFPDVFSESFVKRRPKRGSRSSRLPDEGRRSRDVRRAAGACWRSQSTGSRALLLPARHGVGSGSRTSTTGSSCSSSSGTNTIRIPQPPKVLTIRANSLGVKSRPSIVTKGASGFGASAAHSGLIRLYLGSTPPKRAATTDAARRKTREQVVLLAAR